MPDPNLDPAFYLHLSGHSPRTDYVSPLPLANPVSTSDSVEALRSHEAVVPHSLDFLFPGSKIGCFARYLGAPIGHSDAHALQFMAKRYNHATALLKFLHLLPERSAYQLLRFVTLPRASFLPAVTHPGRVQHYLESFDKAVDDAWVRLAGVGALCSEDINFLLGVRSLPALKSGSGIPRTLALAPSNLFASVKACLPLLRVHSPDMADYLMQSLDRSDPLGFKDAFVRCKSVHDARSF